MLDNSHLISVVGWALRNPRLLILYLLCRSTTRDTLLMLDALPGITALAVVLKNTRYGRCCAWVSLEVLGTKPHLFFHDAR